VDPALARQVLGWTPRVALEDGLRQVVTFFKERRGVAGQERQ
jgi:nucleoside-diphosphate-sugar epimerase